MRFRNYVTGDEFYVGTENRQRDSVASGAQGWGFGLYIVFTLSSCQEVGLGGTGDTACTSQ